MSTTLLAKEKEAPTTAKMADEKQPETQPLTRSHSSLLSKIWSLKDYTPYPRAHENRMSIHTKEVHVSRVALVKAAGQNFFLLQILFFALFCYIFGALYKQGSYLHRLNVVFVDYDGGAVGESIRAAYGKIKGAGFITLQEKTAVEYPDAASLKNAVCRAHYWGAFYITKGSSDVIGNALTAGTDAYNKANIMSFIWNEARYSAILDSSVAEGLTTLASAAKPVYASQDWSNVTDSQNAFSIFADPWNISNDNIQPTSQGSRLIYNTLVIILILIQEFFYLGTLNQLYELFKIYQKLQPRRILFFRNLFSCFYCFFGSLFVTAAIWIFKDGWHVNGNQFVLTWMVLWLFAHLNFLTFDVFTVWLPPPFVPMALIAWVVLNVTSILLPFELQSDFYKWGYAMPAHEVYVTLLDIWSRGCNPVLRYSLPVLFSYEISSFTLSALGVYKRCHLAVIRAEREAAAFQDRVDTALTFEKRKRAENKARELEEKKTHPGGEAVEDGVSRTTSEAKADEAKQDKADEAELGAAMESEYEKLRAMRPSAGDGGGIGPRFGFAFGCPKERDDDEENVPGDGAERVRPSFGMRMISRSKTAGV